MWFILYRALSTSLRHRKIRPCISRCGVLFLSSGLSFPCLIQGFSEHFALYHHGVGASGPRAGWINDFAPYRINHIALRHGDIRWVCFWGNGNRLETLANRGFEQVSFPKSTGPNSPKVSWLRFWGLLLGNWQDVPTREDCQHEEEELQGSMWETGTG